MKGMYFVCLFVLLAAASAGETHAESSLDLIKQESHDLCYYVQIAVPSIGTALTVPRCIFDDVQYGDPIYCIIESLLSVVVSTLISGYLCAIIV